MSGGVKNDKGKSPITLIPSCAITGMADAFAYGANKYGPDNFREGIAYRRLADAAMRHLLAFIEGEDLDKESGNPHIDHALASLAMLKFMTVHKSDMDDRWKPEENKLEENKQADIKTVMVNYGSLFNPETTRYGYILTENGPKRK